MSRAQPAQRSVSAVRAVDDDAGDAPGALESRLPVPSSLAGESDASALPASGALSCSEDPSDSAAPSGAEFPFDPAPLPCSGFYPGSGLSACGRAGSSAASAAKSGAASAEGTTRLWSVGAGSHGMVTKVM